MNSKSHKLLFYVPSLGDGGGERLWAALATAFHKAGYEVQFAQDFEATENRHILDPAISLHTLGSQHLSSIRNLTRLLKETQPDVALSAIAGSNLKLILARWLSGSNTRVIQTFHGHNEWQTGWLSYFTARTLPLTSRLSARTVAVSKSLKTELVKRWRSKRERTIYLPNPVLVPRSIDLPTSSVLNNRAPVVLAVGRLSPEKDYPTLLRAFARLNRPRAHLIILGKGPEQKTISTLTHELGIADQVTLAGYVSEPWHFYQQAKCLALTSASESFGNAIVEALAHGLPVVATATGGAKQILTEPELGYIVPIGDVDAITAALAHCLDDPGDPQARQRRANSFSIHNGVPAYEALIEDVMRETSATKQPAACGGG